MLHHRITLDAIPFTDRNSRILLFKRGNQLQIILSEFGTWPNSPPILTLEWLDRDGAPLDWAFESWAHRLDCTTATGTFTLAFVDSETLMMTLPAGDCSLRFQAGDGSLNLDRRGGVIHRRDGLHIALTTNTTWDNTLTEAPRPLEEGFGVRAALELNIHLHSEGDGVLLLNITRAKALNRYIPSPERVLEAAEKRWSAWFAAVPDVSETYRSQYDFAWWVMGINLIRPYFHPYREGMAPSKMGYVGIWNWDAYFHAIGYRHIDTALAKDQFRILLDHQLDNGMIPDVVHDGGVISHTTDRGIEADITKPPLTAWAVWKVYETDGDRAFLNEVYDPIVRSQQWWFAEHDLDHNGLCEYQHPYSAGLDDSPLYDEGAPVESPDLNAYLILQYDHLAKMAAEIGLSDDAQRWTREAEAMTRRLIDLRWDEEMGLFPSMRGDQRIDVLTPLSLFPLITGRMPKPIADRLVAHLSDEKTFWTHFPVPTVAQNDPKHDPMTMWRGPVWVNINYLLIDGLLRAGYPDVARQLRRRTLDMVMGANDIYEYYHPVTGEKPPRAVSTFGWSSALFIDLVLQEIADEA